MQVTLTMGFAASWLAPRLGAFRAARPDVELMLNPTMQMVDLARSEFDFAIRHGAGAWPGLVSERLLGSPKVVAATPGLLAGRVVDRPEDLTALPWVQELGVEEWRLWLASFGVEAPPKRDVLHLPGHMALEAIRSGQGVGLAARVLVEDDLASGRLVALFEEVEATPEVGYHLVRRPGALRPPAEAFWRWLKREAVRDAGSAGSRPGGAAAPR